MGDVADHRSHGDARGAVGRKRVDAGRDGRKRNRGEAIPGRKGQRYAIAGGEQLVLALAAAAPYRTDRMDDVLRLEAIAVRDLGRSRVTAAQRTALREQLRSGRAMDGTVDAAAAEQRAVRR